MSKFFRQHQSWHDSLDASLPALRLGDFFYGSQIDKTKKALLCYIKQGPVKTSEFCKKEGIKYNTLYKALHDLGETMPIYEDFGEIGLVT